jgi:hypothetical protein
MHSLSPLMEKRKNVWSFNFVALRAFITILWHWWLLEFILNYRNVLSAVVPASGYEEGGSQLMRNTENICMLCFVCSQLGAGHKWEQM